MKRVTLTTLVLLGMLATAASAEYLPTMPPASGIFGTAIDASPSFEDGFHLDDLATPWDDRDIPEYYLMPSWMPGYTAGDALDYHWVWVGILGDHVTWDMGTPVWGVRVYPSQDHGPYTGPNSEFDEYRVWGSNDMGTWTEATQIALYCDDINNVRTHDGVKDYEFAAPYRYCRITSWIDADFELDAVEVLVVQVNIDIKPQSCPNPFRTAGRGVLPVAILGTEDLDVMEVDPATVLLEGVAPLRWNFEDVSTPVESGADTCECSTEGPDGYVDMTLKFDHQEILPALGTVQDGEMRVLTLTGMTIDGMPMEGQDCVVIIHKGAAKLSAETPAEFSLSGNYPNPFNPATSISFKAPNPADWTLKIYNVAGQLVRTFEGSSSGEVTVRWDGTDHSGAKVSSGIYFYKLTARNFTTTKKMVLAK